MNTAEAAALVSVTEQIACVRREIGFRERCYPRWVEGGKMKQPAADRELTAMRAVLMTLEDIEKRGRLL